MFFLFATSLLNDVGDRLLEIVGYFASRRGKKEKKNLCAHKFFAPFFAGFRLGEEGSGLVR